MKKRDYKWLVLCSWLPWVLVPVELHPLKVCKADGFLLMIRICFFSSFFFCLQILQSRYPNLAFVTDHLLDIYIHLTGEKYQASENTDCSSRPVSEDASESRLENKKPNLEGRELSLRLCFLMYSLGRNFISCLWCSGGFMFLNFFFF